MVSWAAPLILSRALAAPPPPAGGVGEGRGAASSLTSGLPPCCLRVSVRGGGLGPLGRSRHSRFAALACALRAVPPQSGGRPPSLPCFASLRVRERASPGPLWCPWSTPGCLSDARGRAVVSFSSPSGESPRVPTVVVACPTSSFLKLRGGGRDGKAGEACVPSPGGAQVDPLSWVSLTVCQ